MENQERCLHLAGPSVTCCRSLPPLEEPQEEAVETKTQRVAGRRMR